MNSPEPIFDVARGDAAVSRQLADALRVLRDNSTDPAVKEQVQAVLSGKIGPRELIRAESFNRILDRVLPDALQRFDEMSDEERAQLAAQGEAELERYRQDVSQSAPPAPPSEPPRWRPADPAPADTPSAPSAPPGQVIPGTRKPNRDRVVTPDEPDDDDRYFGERNRRGWLE